MSSETANPVDSSQQPLKSSAEILSELFGAFNAPPPQFPSDSVKSSDESSSSSEDDKKESKLKKHKKKSKHKKHKKVKKKKHKSSDSSDSDNRKHKKKHKKDRKKSKDGSDSEIKQKLPKSITNNVGISLDHLENDMVDDNIITASDEEANSVSLKDDNNPNKIKKLDSFLDVKSTLDDIFNNVKMVVPSEAPKNSSKSSSSAKETKSTSSGKENEPTQNSFKDIKPVLPVIVKQEPVDRTESVKKSLSSTTTPPVEKDPVQESATKNPTPTLFESNDSSEAKPAADKAKGTTGKIVIKNLKFSSVFEATVREVEEQAKKEAEKYEDGEIHSSSDSDKPESELSEGEKDALEALSPKDDLKDTMKKSSSSKSKSKKCDKKHKSSREKKKRKRSHSDSIRSPSPVRHRKERKTRSRSRSKNRNGTKDRKEISSSRHHSHDRSKRSHSNSRYSSEEKNDHHRLTDRSRHRSHDKDRVHDKDQINDKDRTHDKDRSHDRHRFHDKDRSRDKDRRSLDKDHHRSRSHHRSDHKRRRSRSRSSHRSSERPRGKSEEKIDKKKLLEIARKNTISMLKQGALPEAVLEKTRLSTFKAGGKTVDELTDFCKLLSQKDADGHESISSDTDDSGSESEKPFHHPFQIKDKPSSIVLNIKGAQPLPLKSLQEKTAESAKKLSAQFPVSSGQQHRKTEEWVPVEPKKTEAAPLPVSAPLAITAPPPQPVATPVAQTMPLGPAAVPAPAAPVPVPTPVIPSPLQTNAIAPPPAAIFPPPPVAQVKDIGSIVTQRLMAMRKLVENPHDVEAISSMYKAQQDMRTWAESKQTPGQFTGSTGVRVLSAAELASGPQAWVKKDMLISAKPVSGGMGMTLLQKMGWKPGEGLGKNKEGSLTPLSLEVKMDKKGLVSQEDFPKPPPKAPPPFRANFKSLEGKHPVSLLTEFCLKRRIPPPVFDLCMETGPDHKKNFLYKVRVKGVEYKPGVASPNKKLARKEAAQACLQALGVLPPS